MGFFFSKFGAVADVSTVKSKAGIATGDVEVLLHCEQEEFHGDAEYTDRWKRSHLCGR